jgi:hypothetical protein
VSEPTQSQYRQLIEKTKPGQPSRKSAEGELDRMLAVLEEEKRAEKRPQSKTKADPLQMLREQMIREFVPIFVELVEKYSKSGLAMHMDASNLLEGGREIEFEFGMGGVRIELQGTVTSDSIAFHEVRNAPHIEGQLVAGPMLRLKSLNGQTFRDFVCARLALLIKLASRAPTRV